MAIAILAALGEIGGLIVIGWIARKMRYLNRSEVDRASIFAIDFLMPLLIFSSIIKGFDISAVNTLWPLPVLGFGIVAGGVLVGLGLRYGLAARSADIRRTFVFFCGINNYGYLPIIIVNNIWGTPTMLAQLFLLNLGSTIGVWTIGVNMLGGANLKKCLKNLFAPSLVALIAALSLKFGQVSVPKVIVDITSSAGAAATPLIVILMGASLLDISIKTGWRDMLYSSAIRLVVLPLLFYAVFRLFPLSAEAFNLAMIVALMPVGISSSLFVARFGGDPDFAARCTVVSTILAIATVPILIHFLGR
jgi:predicted permease